MSWDGAATDASVIPKNLTFAIFILQYERLSAGKT